jgi:GlpG protein
MRLARTIWQQSKAEKISKWLQLQGLEVELQPYPVESPTSWRIWILDEDQLEKAKEWIDLIEQDKLHIEDSLLVQEDEKTETPAFLTEQAPKAGLQTSRSWLTPLLIILMVTLHLSIHLLLPSVQATSLLRFLMIDQPESTSTQDLWPGLYRHLLSYIHGQVIDWNWQDFLCDVRQGELWRLLTPALLHGDWIHILFNMLWFNILGSVIETRISKAKYLLLIASSALLSNVAQYFIGGYAFLGFSGVVMALVGFTYARNRFFPWEMYPIPASTFSFIGFYLIFTLCLQTVSFILEAFSLASASIGIANTAHFTGLFVGWLLGKSRAMSLKP